MLGVITLIYGPTAVQYQMRITNRWKVYWRLVNQSKAALRNGDQRLSQPAAQPFQRTPHQSVADAAPTSVGGSVLNAVGGRTVRSDECDGHHRPLTMHIYSNVRGRVLLV